MGCHVYLYLAALRTLIRLLLLLILTTPCQAQAEWDKTLHFVGGNLFGLAGAGAAKQLSKGSRTWTFVGSLAGSALAGLAKEAVDAGQRPDGWDNGDLLATVLGGATVGLSIELFSKKDANGRLRGKYSPVKLPSLTEHGPTRWGPAPGHETLPSLTTLGLSRDLLALR